jgi:anti-sigma regulatory factor (Ser/Thr protein kinase)
LAISYAEKSKLLQAGRWQDEVEARLENPLYAERKAKVKFLAEDDYIQLHISDEGAGFDWQPYLEFSPDRAFDPHGRGISMARMMSFDSLEYQGSGNEVLVRVLRKT